MHNLIIPVDKFSHIELKKERGRGGEREREREREREGGREKKGGREKTKMMNSIFTVSRFISLVTILSNLMAIMRVGKINAKEQI